MARKDCYISTKQSTTIMVLTLISLFHIMEYIKTLIMQSWLKRFGDHQKCYTPKSYLIYFNTLIYNTSYITSLILRHHLLK